MGRIQVHIGLRLLLDDQLHLVRDMLPDGSCRLENLRFGGWLTLDTHTLAAYWTQGRIRFEINGPGVQVNQEQGLAVTYTHADFEALPEHQREAAWDRYRLLTALFQSMPQCHDRL